MSTTPEGKVKDKCKALLKRYGAWFFMPVQSGYGVAGVPDLLVCLPPNGLFVAVETKAPGKMNTLRPAQKMQIEGIKQAGGYALVVDSAELLSDFLKSLEDEGLAKVQSHRPNGK
jgi:hypothetical protein